jgi:hypothetical protein
MSSAEYAVESVEEREMVQLLRMGDAKLKQILLEGTVAGRGMAWTMVLCGSNEVLTYQKWWI